MTMAVLSTDSGNVPRKRSWSSRILLAAGIALLLMVASKFIAFFPDTEVIYTDDWPRPASGGTLNSAALVIRRQEQGSNVFLLTQDERAGVLVYDPEVHGIVASSVPGSFQVYSYDARTREFAPVSKELWDRTDTPITDCRSQSNKPVAHVSRRANQLFVDDQPTRTAAQYVLNLTPSPSERKVAVLSAAGPKNSMGILPFFLSGYGYWGQHYHQTLVVDGGAITRGVRLPFFTALYTIDSCWCPGEQFVVYYDSQGEWITFVAAGNGS